jgi:NAD-dependent deacetylase
MNGQPAELMAAIAKAADLLRKAQHAVAMTGAGYSTPSGIPDFRTAGSGLWSKYLPMEVASLTTFRHNPELFFEWLRPLASHMFTSQPNMAHTSMARLEAAGKIQAVITQNIDGLHTRAGSARVFEIHGTLNTLTCVSCFKKINSSGIIEAYLEHGHIPLCPECQRILKPDIILFQEQLPAKVWLNAENECMKCDLILVAGTSLEVLPAARLPVRALDAGAKLVIVNKTETFVDVRADVILRGDVVDLIPMIAREVLNEQ